MAPILPFTLLGGLVVKYGKVGLRFGAFAGKYAVRWAPYYVFKVRNCICSAESWRQQQHREARALTRLVGRGLVG